MIVYCVERLIVFRMGDFMKMEGVFWGVSIINLCIFFYFVIIWGGVGCFFGEVCGISESFLSEFNCYLNGSL